MLNDLMLNDRMFNDLAHHDLAESRGYPAASVSLTSERRASKFESPRPHQSLEGE